MNVTRQLILADLENGVFLSRRVLQFSQGGSVAIAAQNPRNARNFLKREEWY